LTLPYFVGLGRRLAKLDSFVLVNLILLSKVVVAQHPNFGSDKSLRQQFVVMM
jgi:hypothetical protein